MRCRISKARYEDLKDIASCLRQSPGTLVEGWLDAVIGRYVERYREPIQALREHRRRERESQAAPERLPR